MSLPHESIMRIVYVAGLRHDISLFYLALDVAIGTNVIIGTEEDINNLLNKYYEGYDNSSLYNTRTRTITMIRKRVKANRKYLNNYVNKLINDILTNPNLITAKRHELTRRVRKIIEEQQTKKLEKKQQHHKQFYPKRKMINVGS